LVDHVFPPDLISHERSLAAAIYALQEETSVNITRKHIASERRIGTLDNKPVLEVGTSGGFWMIVCQKSGGMETLGAGPHRAVARYIALKRQPGLRFMELSKSEELDVAQFVAIVPKYERLVEEINALAQ
jgi:hypothetical protein